MAAALIIFFFVYAFHSRPTGYEPKTEVATQAPVKPAAPKTEKQPPAPPAKPQPQPQIKPQPQPEAAHQPQPEAPKTPQPQGGPSVPATPAKPQPQPQPAEAAHQPQPETAKAPQPQAATPVPIVPAVPPISGQVQPPKESAPPAPPTAQPPVSATPPAEPQTQPPTPPPGPPPGEKPSPHVPTLVIVIDDLGGSLDQAQDLLSLDLPVTFSILPDLAHSSEVDALAARADREVILHQPMAARADSRKLRKSRGELHPGMSIPEVASILDAHLAQIPHAVGMNNHEGSKATEDPSLMAAIMMRLKEKGLFFLDSKTTAKSAASKEATRAGVPHLARTVFLDNERGQQAALFVLAQAERDALAHGYAVAIGHPYPATIAALDAWKLRRDKRVKLTTLSSLLKGN